MRSLAFQDYSLRGADSYGPLKILPKNDYNLSR